MIRGWLSREGRPPAPVRVTGTPLAVRVVEVPAVPEMPPRPQLRRPDPELPPMTRGTPMRGPVDPAEDPCGRPAIAAGKSRRRT